jgi:hypothetical protein
VWDRPIIGQTPSKGGTMKSTTCNNTLEDEPFILVPSLIKKTRRFSSTIDELEEIAYQHYNSNSLWKRL